MTERKTRRQENKRRRRGKKSGRFQMDRRTFAFKVLPTALVTASMAAYLLRNMDGDPSVESLEGSLQYIQQEIENNTQLKDLYEYDDENTLRFIAHAENIFTNLTQSPADPHVMAASTHLVNAAGMQVLWESAFLDPAVTSIDYHLVSAKTYMDLDGKMSIAINKDAYGFRKDVVDATIKAGKPFAPTVLEHLLDVALHEPFHYEVGLQALNPPQEYQSFPSRFRYNFYSGLAMEGMNLTTNQPAYSFGPIDEASIYALQHDLLQTQIPFYTHYLETADQITLGKQLFANAGYPNPEDILALRRRPDAPVVFIDSFTMRLDNSPFSGGSVDDAFQYLSAVQNGLAAGDIRAVSSYVQMSNPHE